MNGVDEREVQTKLRQSLYNLVCNKGDNDFKQVVSILFRLKEDTTINDYNIDDTFINIVNNLNMRVQTQILDYFATNKGYSDKCGGWIETYIGWLDPIPMDNEFSYVRDHKIYANIIGHNHITKLVDWYYYPLINMFNVDTRYRNFAVFVMLNGTIDHIIELRTISGNYIRPSKEIFNEANYNEDNFLLKESMYYLSKVKDCMEVLEESNIEYTKIKCASDVISGYINNFIKIPKVECNEEDDEIIIDADDVIIESQTELIGQEAVKLSAKITYSVEDLYKRLFDIMFRLNEEGSIKQADVCIKIKNLLEKQPVFKDARKCEEAVSIIKQLGINLSNLSSSNTSFRGFLSHIKRHQEITEKRSVNRMLLGISFNE